MWRRLTFCFVISLMTLSTAYGSDWMTRPGTIAHAKTLADESGVYLDAVVVDKIMAKRSPACFVVRECFDGKSKIVVMTEPSPQLRLGQTVDIEGTISTSDGQRIITSPTVWGYADKDGNLLRHGPLIKGLLEPTPWEWKIDLTIPTESRASDDVTPPTETELDSPSGAEICTSIAEAKAKSVGTAVELRCKPIASTDTGFFTLGQDGSSDTLNAYYTGTVSTSDRVCRVSGTIQSESEDKVLDVDSGPDYDPQVFEGSIQTAQEGSIAWVKTWPDGHTFATGDITGKIVTRDWTDYLYVEEDNRSSGIRVEKSAHGRHRGERVDVEGTLSTNSNDERRIAATTITQNGSGTLDPLGMNNTWLGGGDFAYIEGPPASGQRGITDATGLNNIGLLTRAWGKVTEIDTTNPAQWFRIDDGSNVQVTVAYPPYGYALDDYASISGISSCEVDTNDDLQRVLRPQPLTVTVNQATGQSDPTNAAPISFSVFFSEPVTDFDDASDVEITGTAGGTKSVTITQTDSEGKEYNVAVSDLTYGTVIATVLAGKAQNISGVWNYASTSTDNTVAYCDGIVYVQTPANGGSDSNSGWRWDDAKATVGAALTTAVTYGQTQVWVAKGTYNERITLPAGKALYGGFVGDGSEDEVTDRPAFPRSVPDQNETVLDGQYGGNVVTATSTNVNNTLNGFTIQHGNYYGVAATSVLTIYNCRITSNYNGIGMTSSLIIGDNEVYENTNYGVYLSGSASGSVYCNSIHNNTHTGLNCENGGSYTINRNLIEYNNTGGSYQGGGVRLYYLTSAAATIVTNNFIRGNGSSKGGGIYCGGSLLNIYGNTIVDNYCGTSNGGAGIYIRNTTGDDHVNIYNNIIDHNTGGYGIYRDNLSPALDYVVTVGWNCFYQNAPGDTAYSGTRGFSFVGYNYYQSPGLSGDRCHLAAGAWCIDKGTSTKYYGSYDIDAETRIVGSTIDIGCDEVQ